MATVPPLTTPAVGAYFTANRYRDELQASIALLRNPPMCQSWRNANQSIPNATWTLVQWDSDRFDTDGGTMHDPSGLTTPAARIVAQTAGTFTFDVAIAFAGIAGGTGNRLMQIRKNSGGAFGGGTGLSQDLRPGSTGTAGPSCTATEPMGVGDYIDVWVYQDSGAALNLTGGLQNNRITARMVATA